jgi:L-fuculose-phosphate aldolase
MDQPLWKIKEEMCEVGRRIWQRGFCAANEGNHSVRLGPDRVLCTPTGVSKGFMEPDDMVVLDMDAKQVEPNPRGRKGTSEVKVHLGIYKARPKVKAVVHSHPPHATAFAITNMPLPEGIYSEYETFLGRVPIAPYATPGTYDLPDSIIEVLKPGTNTVLMGNHGAVTFSETLLDAYYKMEILDQYARILLLTRQIGPPRVLSPEQMVSILQIKDKLGLADPRLQCAAEGCVGEVNQPFFTTFDVRPATAVCSCDNDSQGHVLHRERQSEGAPAGVDESAFETMVQAITDQIMAAAR